MSDAHALQVAPGPRRKMPVLRCGWELARPSAFDTAERGSSETNGNPGGQKSAFAPKPALVSSVNRTPDARSSIPVQSPPGAHGS